MSGELGNERNIDALLGSSATPPPIFPSVGNDDFVVKVVLKNRRFFSFCLLSMYNSLRSSRNIKAS